MSALTFASCGEVCTRRSGKGLVTQASAAPSRFDIAPKGALAPSRKHETQNRPRTLTITNARKKMSAAEKRSWIDKLGPDAFWTNQIDEMEDGENFRAMLESAFGPIGARNGADSEYEEVQDQSLDEMGDWARELIEEFEDAGLPYREHWPQKKVMVPLKTDEEIEAEWQESVGELSLGFRWSVGQQMGREGAPEDVAVKKFVPKIMKGIKYPNWNLAELYKKARNGEPEEWDKLLGLEELREATGWMGPNGPNFERPWGLDGFEETEEWQLEHIPSVAMERKYPDRCLCRVRNVKDTTTEDDLEKVCAKYGEVLSIKLFTEKDPDFEIYSTIARVEFATTEARDAFMKDDEENGGGEGLGPLEGLVKTPAEWKEEESIRSNDGFPRDCYKLRFINLQAAVDEEQLKAVGEKYGKVIECFFKPNKGYRLGFLKWETNEAAKLADQKLEAEHPELFTTEEERVAMREAKREADWEKEGTDDPNWGSPESARKLVVKSIPRTVDDDVLKERFEEWGEVIHAVVNRDYQGDSIGTGVVTFAKKKACQTAWAAANDMPYRGLWDPALYEIDEAAKVAAFDPENPPPNPDGSMPSKKIRLNNIKEELNEADVRDTLSKYGDFDDRYCTGVREDRSMVVAFTTFAAAEAAATAGQGKEYDELFMCPTLKPIRPWEIEGF